MSFFLILPLLFIIPIFAVSIFSYFIFFPFAIIEGVIPFYAHYKLEFYKDAWDSKKWMKDISYHGFRIENIAYLSFGVLLKSLLFLVSYTSFLLILKNFF